MNLNSPIFDRIRIPTRRTPESIAAAICKEAGVDPAAVRRGQLLSRRGGSHKMYELRCRIARAMRNAGVAFPSIVAWFEGISPRTVHTYLYDPIGGEARPDA